jgi:hypothetical protein
MKPVLRPVFEYREREYHLGLYQANQLVRDTHRFRRELIRELKAPTPDPEKTHGLAVKLFKHLRQIEARLTGHYRKWPIRWRPRKYLNDP